MYSAEKQKPIVTKQYLGFIRTYDSFVNLAPAFYSLF